MVVRYGTFAVHHTHHCIQTGLYPKQHAPAVTTVATPVPSTAFNRASFALAGETPSILHSQSPTAYKLQHRCCRLQTPLQSSRGSMDAWMPW